jgi:hypothetical protein
LSSDVTLMFEILPRKTSKLLSRVQTPACSKNPDATCVGIPHESSTIETLHSLKEKIEIRMCKSLYRRRVECPEMVWLDLRLNLQVARTSNRQ